MMSNPFSGHLFDPSVLSEIIKEHQGEVQVQANVIMASAIAQVIPSLAKNRGIKRKAPQSNPKPPPQGMAAAGSPLTGPPSSSSGSSAPRFAGRRARKSGRGRGDRGRGGAQSKVNQKASVNPNQGFQS